MSFDASQILHHVAVSIGLATMAWALVVSAIEKKKAAKRATVPSGWAESYFQAVTRYLTKKQQIAFVSAMGFALGLAVVAALL